MTKLSFDDASMHAMNRMQKRCSLLSWHLWFVLLLCFTRPGIAEENLYKILGVTKTATTKEIKQAYRRKALDTHPDKNKGVPPEEAAAAFQKVVHAFEVLSDESSRRQYDRTGRTSGATSTENNNQGWDFGFSNFHGFRSGGFQWSRTTYHRQKLKDKFQVKEAMSRVMHVVSWEQLQTVMLDDDGKLERNLLICFVNPEQEKIADDEMVFPYPFAAMSSQGIWWEDLLQTVKIRYHNQNDITKFFGIPIGKDLKTPIFVFAKRGQTLEEGEQYERLETKSRQTFENWVWERISVDVEFVNNHPHPVEIFWIHGTRAEKKLILDPGERSTHTTMLSHEWWVRDARTDTRKDSPWRGKLTDNNCLAKWKIVSDEHRQVLVIEEQTCYDLSGHCYFWASQGECHKNPSFMHDQCRKSCKQCVDGDGSEDEL